MSLEPTRHNWTIWRGATFHKRITLLSGDAESDPRDLTSYTALLEIKDKRDGTVLYTLTTGDASIVIGGVLGTIELIISADDTAALTWDSGVYDLTITAPGVNGETDALLFGAFKVQGV